MAEFAEQISALPLYKELDRAAGRDAIPASDVSILKGLVNDVADTVGPVLARIPLIFRQYTVHDISHSRNVIERMGDILPQTTRENLNPLEITFLLLAALLHDVGMAVTDQEKAETLASESFRMGHQEQNKAIEDARAAGNEPRAQAIQEAMLADHYRRLHAQRAKLFMDHHLKRRLRFREVDFTEDLARLCESHAWGVEESNDAGHPQNAVSRLDDNVRLYGVRVNLQYLACILRLGDILDFDRSRTPLAVFQHLDFSGSKSWEEWNKHLQVKGYEITPTQVAFEIPCTHPVFYVAVHEFLGWNDDELQQCRYLVENKPPATADRYQLHLPQVVDRHKVRMADPSFVAGAFRFQLEYENILTLLMDKSLYPDPSLFLRELLQNALDACRRKEAAIEVDELETPYKPKIVVWDRTDDPDDPRVVFQDNGIGMSQRIVEHYFLRVGRSYYRSPEFDAERQRLRAKGKELDACSQFGIGILSCFLVGDRFEVETYQEGNDPLHILIEGPTKYFVMRRLPRPTENLRSKKPSSDEGDGPPNRTGTRVTVHFRAGVRVDVWGTLETFAVNVDYPITIHRAEWKEPRTVEALRWEKPVREFSGLEEALVVSVIPFSRWSFSRHLRGCSWFCLLRDPNGKPTPNTGFLEVRSGLKLAGLASIVEKFDIEHFRGLSYKKWLVWLRHVETEEPFSPIAQTWLGLSDYDRSLLDEVIAKRIRLLKHAKNFSHWVEHPEVVRSLLRGSLEWVDQPVYLEHIPSSDLEERFAIHSILLPAGIVEWSPIRAHSTQLSVRPMFGGLLMDARGPQAPRPAAHRLFVSSEETTAFRHQYFSASLLHGLDLMDQHGRTQDWRAWFCELARSSLFRGLNQSVFARLSGTLVEDVCGLAVKINDDVFYLSRAEISNLIPGPLSLVDKEGRSQGLLRSDPVNTLLCDADICRPLSSWLFSDKWDEKIEVDVSTFPFVRVKR